ncbi:hypothetical protein CR513_61094, partial [Mucuna pruriens]
MAKGSVLKEEMRRKARGSSSRSEENKGKKGKSKEKNHDDDDDHVTTAKGDDLVILRDFDLVNLVYDESMWIIDSGATLHVTPRKEFFTSYTLGDFRVLKMGNNGVSKVKSFSGALYFDTFIDDCFKKLWIYTLKTKDQVLEKFKQLQALVERQSCKKSEALYTIVHVINLSPIVSLNTEVLNKNWFSKDVKYDHLRVFGCKAFVHVPKNERSKLDMKTRQCIFIGYGQDEYGYKLYDLVEKKLARSCDVQFIEDQTIESIYKLRDVFDIPPHDDAEEEQEMSQDENLGDALEPSLVQLRKSNR